MAAASGPAAPVLAGPTAADPEGFIAAASSITPTLQPLVVPGLEPLWDSAELQAGPPLLPASPAATASGDALLVAAASPSPAMVAASGPAAPVLAGPTAADPQGFIAAANSITLAPSVVPGLEIVENTGMTDPLYGFAPAAPTWVPFGSFAANGLRIDLGGGVSRTGPDDPLADDHAPTPAAPAVPAVIPVAPLPRLSAPGMTGLAPDAVDAVLIRYGSDPEAALEQADERVGSEGTNAAAVVMGVVALAWRWRSYLGRQGNDRDRERRYQRPDPQRRLPGGIRGINQAGDRK